MDFKEVNTNPQGNGLLTQYIKSQLVETPIQTLVFKEKKFLPKDVDVYYTKNIKATRKIAQIVGQYSEAKNVREEKKIESQEIKLYPSRETDSVGIDEVTNFGEIEEQYLKEHRAAQNGKYPFIPSGALQEKLDWLKQQRLYTVGLNLAARQFFLRQAKQNSCISRGIWEYADSEISNVKIDFGIDIKFPQGVSWSDLDNATPLKDLDFAFDAMRKNRQTPFAIFMGEDAATNFERNRKEVSSMFQFMPQLPEVKVSNPKVSIAESIMDTNAGYKLVGSYKQLPIYSISNEVVVPQTDGNSETVQTFDPYAVSIVAKDNVMGVQNFVDVFGNLAFFQSAENNELVIISKEYVVYYGDLSSDKTRKNYFSMSKHAPIIENPDALYIFNVA